MKKDNTTKQVGKFGVVGILNTLIDVFILNILIKIGLSMEFLFLGYKIIGANIISVTAGMINSYFFNKYWTFHASEEKNKTQEIFKFIFVTVIGMFIIHQIAFNFLLTYWTWPVGIVVKIVHFVKLNNIFSDNFVILNSAKIVAVIFSLVWNFIGYKIWVFKEK